MKKYLLNILLVFSLCGCSESIEPTSDIDSSIDTEDIYERINIYLDSFITNGYVLPTTIDEISDITWSIDSGDAYITDNVIFKSDSADEYEPIVLKANVNDNEYVFDNILLLDEYKAYVISYFTENGDEKETMKLAYTYDGVYWYKLNEDYAVLKPTIGTKRLRDPSLLRTKDGHFAVLATQGYNTDSIYVYDSKDLITFENERLLKVNSSTQDLPMSEKQAWAPECFYDRTLNQYVIYWSSIEDGGMYYNLSDDLVSFSYPDKLLDAGFEVIDGTIVKDKNMFYIVLKDEREPMSEHTQLFMGRKKNTWQNIDEFSDMFTGHQSEGPMVLKDLYVSGYYIIYDDYTRFQFQALHTEDLFEGPYKKIDSKDTMFPFIDPAHCHGIPITWKELERLIAVYEN